MMDEKPQKVRMKENKHVTTDENIDIVQVKRFLLYITLKMFTESPIGF